MGSYPKLRPEVNLLSSPLASLQGTSQKHSKDCLESWDQCQDDSVGMVGSLAATSCTNRTCHDRCHSCRNRFCQQETPNRWDLMIVDGHLGEFSLPNKERRLASMKWMEKEGSLMLIGPAQGRRFIHLVSLVFLALQLKLSVATYLVLHVFLLQLFETPGIIKEGETWGLLHDDSTFFWERRESWWGGGLFHYLARWKCDVLGHFKLLLTLGGPLRPKPGGSSAINAPKTRSKQTTDSPCCSLLHLLAPPKRWSNMSKGITFTYCNRKSIHANIPHIVEELHAWCRPTLALANYIMAGDHAGKPSWFRCFIRQNFDAVIDSSWMLYVVCCENDVVVVMMMMMMMTTTKLYEAVVPKLFPYISTSRGCSQFSPWTAWTPATNQSTRAIKGTGVVVDPFEGLRHAEDGLLMFIVQSIIGRLSLKHQMLLCISHVMCANLRIFLNISISRYSICCIAQACAEVQQVVDIPQRICSRASSIEHPRNIKFPGLRAVAGACCTLTQLHTTITYKEKRYQPSKDSSMPMNSPWYSPKLRRSRKNDKAEKLEVVSSDMKLEGV